MHTHGFRLYGIWLVLVVSATPALAQFRPRPLADAPLAERYIIEAQGGLWNPGPEMSITSESLGILGTKIDFKSDLGLAQTRFKEFRATLHPARKHKLRFQYVPITYEQSSTLRRTLVFNGQRYDLGVPVRSELEWKAYRFSYEYDFVSMSRGFGGFVLDLKQTDVTARLRSPLLEEFTKLQAPIPSIGGIARIYLSPAVSVTGELSGIKIPRNEQYDFNGHYADLDIYGTLNVNRHVGAQFGYRSFDVEAFINDDSGAFTLKGIYFGFVARY
ncbi:MAG: hypothetical protein FJW27_02610 [Acidimicrobiia bacterium]|nr:hypothetical protein [Acidimicrobiia bacterium]